MNRPQIKTYYTGRLQMIAYQNSAQIITELFGSISLPYCNFVLSFAGPDKKIILAMNFDLTNLIALNSILQLRPEEYSRVFIVDRSSNNNFIFKTKLTFQQQIATIEVNNVFNGQQYTGSLAFQKDELILNLSSVIKELLIIYDKIPLDMIYMIEKQQNTQQQIVQTNNVPMQANSISSQVVNSTTPTVHNIEPVQNSSSSFESQQNNIVNSPNPFVNNNNNQSSGGLF